MTNHPHRNLTPKQREMLGQIYENGCDGVCLRGVWTWKIGHDIVTRQVNVLLKKKLVDGLYFRGGRAAINLTEEGRAALAG